MNTGHLPGQGVASRTSTPKKSGDDTKQPGIGRGQIVVTGPGLVLCAPRASTSFNVSSTDGRKLKAADLKITIKGSAAVKHEVKERQDGSLDISYAAPMSGEYRITMALGSFPVPGSPFRVPCQQPRPCEVLSRVHYGSGQAFSGERYSTRVTVLDQFSQRVAGDPRLTANVMDGETVLFAADVTPTDSVGDWMVSFTPTISGTYQLVLAFEGNRALTGTPHRVRVKTDETVAGNCKLYGAGLTRAIAGERTSFSIKAVDGKNNARLVGGDEFQVEIVGPGNASAKPDIVDNNDGTYTVHWVTERAGDYLITGWLEGATVGGCAKACAVQPAELDASRCSCAGEGLGRAVAGIPATFTVTACDRFGNKQTAGGDDISVRVMCIGGGRSGSVAGKVEDAGRALYKVAYTVSTAGQHEVAVLAGGRPVPGSPFRAEVAPGQVSAGACRLFGPGLSAIQLGRDMRIFVALADAFGNAITEAGSIEPANVKVALEGPAETHVRRGPVESDGSHAFSYSTKTPGDYVIAATVAGAHMQGSPAPVTASIAEAHAPLCEVVGTPLHLSTVAGQSADVTFVAKDAKGFQKSLGGDVFTVSWQRLGQDDEPATTGKVEDLGTGEYRARFAAMAAGTHSVWVQHKGHNIAGSPFTAEVEHAAIAADCSYVVQEGLERGVSGAQVCFRVRAMDKYLNLVRLPLNDSEAVGPKGFQAMLLGPGNNEQSLELVPNRASSGGCELSGSFVPRGAGLAALAVTYQGHHIKGSPWQVTITCGPACARKSALVGMPQHLVAGVPRALTVYARDASGCPTEGRDTVSITVDSVSEGVRVLSIKDCRDGTYTAPIRLEKIGLVSISAQISGQPLGLPVTLRVLAAELHSLELISPQNPQVIAGEPAFVAVRGRDAFMNPIQSGGARLSAQLRRFCSAEVAKADVAAAEIRDRGDGIYEIDCALKTACDFEVSVHVEDLPETKVTCAGMCRPAATCPARCDLPALPASLPAAQPGSLATWRFDRFGNRITSCVGEAPFLATATGPGELKTKVLEKGDGSVEIRYCASKIGSYSLAVTSSRDGEPLAGSPFQFDVTSGQLSPCHCTAELAAPTLVAGQKAAIVIDAKDIHGNQVDCMEGHDVAVHVQGPCAVAFAQEGGSQGSYTAVVPVSGTYLAHVQINGHTLGGWPKPLHVAAAASDASRCTFLGRFLAGGAHIIGEPWRFALHTADGYGNVRAAGGEAVTVEVAGPAGSAVRAAAVTDRGNGCYAVAFEPDCAGRWVLTPRVNGQAIREGGFEVHAAYGAAAAHECAVAGLSETGDHTCGAATELRVVPAGKHAAGRAFLGTEVVHAHLTGASGARKRVVATLAEDGRAWKLALPWFEPGSHAVAVSVNGARVPSGAFSAEAAPRDKCLAASAFAGPGLDGCTAGEPARFEIRSRDARGHAVPGGEAAFVVEVFAGEERVTGDVQFEGDGLSTVTYTVTQAGPVRIAASLVGGAATRAFETVCRPGPLALSKCTILEHSASVAVGEKARLLIKQADRFGNASESHLDQLRFELKPTGPGPLSHWWEHGEDNAICLAYSAERSGTYQLSIKDAKTKEMLPGSPFTVAMEAAAPVASHSTARFGAGVDKAGVAVAGQALTICASLNDKFGNSTSGEAALRVWAAGPADVEMERTGASEYMAMLTAAGTYTIKATLDGAMLPEWPKTVVVTASPSGAASCRLRGHVLTGITCKALHTLSLAVYDSFDNPRTSGGDKVEAWLCGPEEALVPATVTDLKNGSYSVEFCVARAGAWTLKPRVNGESLEAAQRTLHATYGPVSASDCQVAWAAEPVLDCGAPNKLCLYPKGLEDGWKMTGHETAGVVLHTTGGVPLVQPLSFNQEGGYYEATIIAVEAGLHTIYAHIDHEAVDGSPLVLDAKPGAPCLAASRINESALTSAVAGEHCSVLLTAFNEFGDPITCGSAAITAALMSHGAGSAVDVEDNGDGTYGLCFAPTEAGPFELVVSLEKPGHAASKALRRRNFAGVCAAGTTAAQCCVATTPSCQLDAGESGSMLLRRADRFGNEVLSSIGEAPFVLSASGPGTMQHAIREMGDGQSELCYSATVAGSYTLSVRCLNSNSSVQGTPLPVQVSAAPVSAAKSKAQLSGRAPNSLVPAGEDVEVLVTLRDAYGNPSDKLTGRQVDIRATGPELVSFSATASNRFSATLTLAGSYAISACIGNQMLPGWPLAVHVQPAACCATKCWLSGPAMQSVVCGQLSTVTLHAADRYGNAHVSGGEEVTAQLRGGPSRGIPSTVKANAVDNWDGTYALQFALPIEGEWELSAAVGGEGVPCAAAASVRAEYGPLTAEECEIENVDGMVACGTSDPIFIQAAGGRRMTGHEAVSCTVTAPNGTVHAVPVTLADGGGHFQATLHWMQVGVHKITAYLEGRVIPSTPINVKVGPAGIHAPACLVRGLTDTPDFGMLEFEVHGRDPFGNMLELLPRMIEVWSEPANALTDLAMAQWEEASVITVRANVAAAGKLHVKVNGKPVVPGGHPLLAAPSETSLLAFVAPAVACRAGERATVLLQLQDARGSSLPAGGDVVSAVLTHKDAGEDSLPSVEVIDRGTGLYELHFTITKAGEYALTAQLRGSSTAAAACAVTVAPGPTSALHSRSDMTGLCKWRAGEPGTLLIFRKDRHRNAVADAAGEPPLGASLTGPGPADAVVREGGNAAQTGSEPEAAAAAVEVLCSARTAGDYVLSVFHLDTGERLFGSPFAVQLRPGAIMAAASSYRVTGSTEDADPCMSAGQEVEIALAARDAYGNAVVDMEPGALRAAATGASGAVRFQAVEASNSGRQHYLRAVFTRAGVYDIAVSVTDPVTGEALQIPSQAASQRLRITPGALDLARTQIADLPSVLTAGAPANFVITPFDAHGNAGASGGRFAAELIQVAEPAAEGSPRSMECDVTETSSGTRTAVVALQAQTAGAYILRILLFPDASLHKENRQPEVLRESRVAVREAGASSARSFLTGFWPQQGAVAGVPAGFVIQACDEFGNARKRGGDRFKAAIRGLDGDAVAVTDRGDGSYGLRYTAPSEGTFSLAVTGADGCDVGGSPATLTVFRDVNAMAAAEMQRRLAAGMMGLRRGLSAARSLHSSLRSEATALESFIPVIVEGARSGMQQALQNQEAVLAESRAALSRESAARRRLHNMVQELRGNIRVFVRVKPSEPAGRSGAPVLACEDSHRISCTAAGSTKAFEFDRVFGPESSQEQIFGEVSQLITSALDGYNVCIFAYGQTGAGKTYTMEGTRQDPGINYRTMKELFRCIKEDREGGTTYDITTSIVELYNEQVWDLLAESGKKEVELVKATSGAGFNVPDLTQVAVTSPEQILDIMARGFEQRATGCHDINAHSSRSHCLLIVHAATTDPATGVRSVGKLTLCDLAGSERINKTGASGLTLTEAQNINRSLLELGNVISALMQQSSHVPYRNSKLTMLLQDSLGGNAKALMVANLAPSPAHASETLSSLAFASKVANVVLKTPQRKFEDVPTAGEGPPAVGKAGGTQSLAARSGALRSNLSADRPRLRAAQPSGPAAGSKLKTFGP